MKRAASFTHEQNVEDARNFAGILRTLAEMSKPTITRAQGAALGSGTGLTAARIMAVTSSGAVFLSSEVKLSIIPSAISPYVLRYIQRATDETKNGIAAFLDKRPPGWLSD